MWLLASVISLMALGILVGSSANNILGFLIVLLSAIMFTPLIQKAVRVKAKKEIKPEMYLLTGCLLLLAGATVSIGNNEQIKETNEKTRAMNEENGSSVQESDEDKQVDEDSMKVEEQSQPEPIAIGIYTNFLAASEKYFSSSEE